MFHFTRKYDDYHSLQGSDGSTDQSIIDEKLLADATGIDDDGLSSQASSINDEAELENVPSKEFSSKNVIWLLVCSALIFTVSSIGFLVMQGRLDDVCLEVMEPWSRQPTLSRDHASQLF